MKQHLHQWTTLNPVIMHNLEDDQKRLQETFGDDKLFLRYNYHPSLKCCQIWYNAPSCPYIVLNMKGHYSFGWAIWELRRRQRNRRELLAMYNAQFEKNEAAFDEKNEALARETAQLYSDYKVGKVVTSGHTKCLN